MRAGLAGLHPEGQPAAPPPGRNVIGLGGKEGKKRQPAHRGGHKVLGVGGFSSDGQVQDREAAQEKLKSDKVEGEQVLFGQKLSGPYKAQFQRTKLKLVLDGQLVGGLGIAIISTSTGLLTDRQANKKGVGGEVLAYVW